MLPAYDFNLALTRVIEPTRGPGAELATLQDAARFVGLLRTWRQARPHWDFAAELLLKAAETRKRRDVEGADIRTPPAGATAVRWFCRFASCAAYRTAPLRN